MPATLETPVAMIKVNRGDYMAFKNGSGWFKASADTKCTPQVPTLARALESFEYEDGVGATVEPQETLPNIPVARYYRKATPAGTFGPGTPELCSGHRKLMSEQESDRYIDYWVKGIVKKAIYDGKGIREIVGFDGLITHRFSVSQINPEW